MKKNKILTLSISVLAVFGIASTVLADTPPIANCSKYLGMSDAQFDSILGNARTAQTIATELGECLRYNACSTLSSINNCSATLANRTFLSNYHANFNDNSFGSSAGAPNSNATASNGYSNNSAPLPSISISPQSISPNTSSNSGNSSAPKSSGSSSSIHWY